MNNHILFRYIYTTPQVCGIEGCNLVQATLLKPPPGGPLSHKQWLLPRDNDILDIYLVLPYPARIHGMLIFPSPFNLTCMTSPKMVDVKAGPYMDQMRVITEGLALPSGVSGQPLLYELPRVSPTASKVKTWVGIATLVEDFLMVSM